MTTLKVEIGKGGIGRVYSEVGSVSDSRLAGELLEVASLGFRLVHDSIREHFGTMTFREELLEEITAILDSPLRAVQLVEHLCWDELKGSSYADVKAKIVEARLEGRKVDPSMHEDFLLVIGIFYKQVKMDRGK